MKIQVLGFITFPWFLDKAITLSLQQEFIYAWYGWDSNLPPTAQKSSLLPLDHTCCPSLKIKRDIYCDFYWVVIYNSYAPVASEMSQFIYRMHWILLQWQERAVGGEGGWVDTACRDCYAVVHSERDKQIIVLY